MKSKSYPWYMWVYAVGTIVTLINCRFFQNTILFHLSLVVLYGILFYKGIHILHCYRHSQHRYSPIDKADFAQTYRPFRIRVSLFWLAFIALCVVAKWVVSIDAAYFYSCTYFFLLLDRLFVNVGCLLQKFSDMHPKVIQCCCGCPCRGWDLMMIHTPLLFALQSQAIVENSLICLSSALAAIALYWWEKTKYSLVEVRGKCANACNLTLCREHRPTL